MKPALLKPIAAIVALMAVGCATNESVANAFRVPAYREQTAFPRASSVSGDLYVSNRPGPVYKGSKITCATWASVYRAGTATMLRKLPGLCKGRDGNSDAAFDKDDNYSWGDFFNGAVLVFAPGKTKPSYTIAWGAPAPYALAVDGSGELYVANFGPFISGYGQPSVAVYAHGKAVPSYTITKGITFPLYVALDASGNLFVANCPLCASQYSSSSGQGNVTVYAPGKKTPSRVLYDGIVEPYALVIDGQGNLYVANRICGRDICKQGNVVVYAPGKQSPSLTITEGISAPSALAVDSSGTLYVSSAQHISEYAKGQKTPDATITLDGCGAGALTFDGTGDLYALLVDCKSSSPTPNGGVAVYAQGQTTPTYTITKGIDSPKDTFAIAP
jgi:sugar lactone lactonase YvrE